MTRLPQGLLGLALVLCLPAALVAQSRPLYPVFPVPAAMQFNEEVALQKLVAAIDRHMEAFWKENDIKPAEPASDAEFLRRVSLDLVGHIPHAAEVRAFMADQRPDKRGKKIDELLGRAGHVNYLASALRREWVPQTNDTPDFRLLQAGFQFEAWIRDRLRTNAGQDEIVRDLLTAPTLYNRGQVPSGRFDEPSPMAFNQVAEFKPENVAASASRLFMGVKLECAQCHNHPFATYTREQFWEQAAFFADVQPTIANLPNSELKRQIRIPDTPKTVQAKFFNGKEPSWKDDESPRQTFVNWLTAPENPYFARNAANRLWAHFFGLGFTDPIDEPSDSNQPFIPELLNDLAKAYADSKYDNRFLMRALARSKAYQLSSKMSDPTQENPRYFARMNVKGMSGEQLYDSLAVATGFRDRSVNRGPFDRGGPRNEFLSKFASNEKRTEQQTSILQALTLMNGRLVNDQTNVQRSELLAAVADFPFRTTEDRVETAFLTVLSRPPTAEELQKFTSFIERGGADSDKKKGLADVFWALLNSSEFVLNH
jgi:Protein of unknown function (DUF1549)/Protein of unknown function (DUF1553)